jgi:hypothetical protein
VKRPTSQGTPFQGSLPFAGRMDFLGTRVSGWEFYSRALHAQDEIILLVLFLGDGLYRSLFGHFVTLNFHAAKGAKRDCQIFPRSAFRIR